GSFFPLQPPRGKPYVRLRLLVTLRSRLSRRKGAKKIIQVVPSLRGLQTRGTALSFVPSETICFSHRTRKSSKRYIARKKLVCIFEEATYSAYANFTIYNSS